MECGAAVGFLLDPDISGPIDEVNIVVFEDEAMLEMQTVSNVLVEVKLRLDDCEAISHGTVGAALSQLRGASTAERWQ